MKIIKVKIDDLIPYENNAKLHPREQIEQLKKSILEFGNNDPIAIDENNVIIEGHGRVEALSELGYNEAECIRLTDLSEEQKNAYRIVHNQLTMNTDWDMERLKEELQNISLDMVELGIDESLLDELEEQLHEPEEEEALNPESNFNYKEQYGVIVMCKNEAEQEKIYNHLIEEGYECKVVAT